MPVISVDPQRGLLWYSSLIGHSISTESYKNAVAMESCWLFSCRQLDSKETYLANISTGCSSPPQGERRIGASTRNISQQLSMTTGATENSSGELLIIYLIRVHLLSGRSRVHSHSMLKFLLSNISRTCNSSRVLEYEVALKPCGILLMWHVTATCTLVT